MFLIDQEYRDNWTLYIHFALSNNNFTCLFDRFVHFGEKVECHCEAPNCQGYLGNQIKNPTQNALAIKEEQEKSCEHSPIQHGSSASILHSMTHLLPWTNPNCIEVSFNLRSKSKITRICWVGKRKRTSLVASYNKNANVTEWSSCWNSSIGLSCTIISWYILYMQLVGNNSFTLLYVLLPATFFLQSHREFSLFTVASLLKPCTQIFWCNLWLWLSILVYEMMLQNLKPFEDVTSSMQH